MADRKTDHKNGETWIEDQQLPDERFGAVTFAYTGTKFKKKGMSTIATPLYRCPICDRKSERRHAAAAFSTHLETHDRQNERARIKKALGGSMFEKPLNGQLGFGLLGVGEVGAKAKRAKSAKKSSAQPRVG